MKKPPPVEPSRDDFDNPWKVILEDWLPSIIELLDPELYEQIDWAKGFISLSQELKRLFRDGESRAATVDKLFEVFLKNGKKARCLWNEMKAYEKEQKMPFLDMAQREQLEQGIALGEVKKLRELVLELFNSQHPRQAKTRKAIGSQSDEPTLKAIFDLLVARGSLSEIQSILKGTS